MKKQNLVKERSPSKGDDLLKLIVVAVILTVLGGVIASATDKEGSGLKDGLRFVPFTLVGSSLLGSITFIVVRLMRGGLCEQQGRRQIFFSLLTAVTLLAIFAKYFLYAHIPRG
jgi:hypothetical protein